MAFAPPSAPTRAAPASDGASGAATGAARQGLFIAFEGGDGAGKTTQIGLLREWLTDQGLRTVLTREPGGTPLGQAIRELLLHGREEAAPRAEALLFAADRAQHVERVILPGLEAGSVVLTDRYLDSSVAYQGGGRDLPAQDVLGLSLWAVQGLLPDLTVLLDVHPKRGRARREGADDKVEAEPDDFHARVRSAFLRLAQAAPERYVVVDAALPPHEIADVIIARVAPLLPRVLSASEAR